MIDLYAIAAGYNVPLINLVNIASITPSGEEPFATPKVVPEYNPGLVKVRTDGQIDTLGFRAVTWLFGFLSFNQWSYLSNVYCAGTLSGQVTIYTTLGQQNAYVRLNAIMVLKKPIDLRSTVRYGETPVQFTRLATAS